MNLDAIATIITQTLIYAAPLILTALGGVFLNEVGLLTLVWKVSWLWGPLVQWSLT